MGTALPVGIPQKNRKDMSCGLLPPDLVHHRPSIPWSLSSPSSWPLPAGQLSPFRFFQAPSGPYHSYLHQTKKTYWHLFFVGWFFSCCHLCHFLLFLLLSLFRYRCWLVLMLSHLRLSFLPLLRPWF